VPVKLLVVSNELGTVAMKQTAHNAEDEDILKGIYAELRQAVGGNLFSESMFHLTVPIPKTSTATEITPPTESDL
jgi:hypothetical protein